jgi:hypothetical protein
LKNRSQIPVLELTDGSLAITDIEKCEALADQYDTVFQNDNGIPLSDKYKYNNNHLITVQFDGLEIYKKLKSLKRKTSSGYDQIPPVVLQALSIEFSQILKLIFQLSLNTTNIPEEWLKSIITPVPKKLNSSLPIDYRPISLTCTACRVMESIILDKIVEHMEKEELFSKNQHGFLRKRGTITCIHECFDSWVESFEKNYSIDILFIDIAKAFDSTYNTC